MKNLILIAFIMSLVVGCNSADVSCNETYFGGHIVNPKSKYVILSKDEKVLDTIFLNADNTFATVIDDIDDGGLYSFNHGPEYQYFYIEPKDSILIRLNTWDFDESLVFSGRGAEKNNFLITLYLQNEKEGKAFSPYYNLGAEEFEAKIAVAKSLNMHVLEQLKSSGVVLSDGFNELANVAVNYPINRRKEIYPFVHKNRFQLDSYPVVSATYYDFRKSNDLNNEELSYFAPYHNYVSSYIYAVAYKENNLIKDSNLTENILNTIIENITVEEFKNDLMRQAIYNDFREAKSACAINKNALKIFNEHCTNRAFLDQINILAKDCESIKSKNPMVNFELVAVNNHKTNIRSVIRNKKAVIYFWSSEMMNPELLIKRVKSLEEKYPSLLFIGINMQPSTNNNKMNLALGNQYALTEESDGNRFIASKEPRTILVDEKGIIANSFTYLSSQYLERQLTRLEQNEPAL